MKKEKLKSVVSLVKVVSVSAPSLYEVSKILPSLNYYEALFHASLALLLVSAMIFIELELKNKFLGNIKV